MEQVLIKKNANIGAMDDRGKTSLHIAFEKNHLHLVDLILSSGTIGKCNPVDGRGLSHFHISCTRNNLSTIKSFLNNGANVNECVKVDSSFWPGFTPLHFAVTFQRLEVVRLLIKSGADITIKNGDDLTLIEQAFKSLGSHSSDRSFILPLIELLLLECKKKKIDSFPDKRISLLHIACTRNDVNFLERRLNPDNVNSPVDLDCPIWPGFTPLHFAVKYMSREVIALLLKAGANVSLKDASGNTPLHLAHLKGHFNGSLISYRDNPTGQSGWSHFHIACQKNCLKAVERLLELGINVNEPIKSKTPLHLAVANANCSDNLVLLLLKNGANVEALDECGKTPLQVAVRRAKYSVVALLFEFGANIGVLDAKKRTLLHLAAKIMDNGKMIRQLLKYGADARARDVDSKTPLHYCLSSTSVDLLMEDGAEVDALDVNHETPLMSSFDSIASDVVEALLRHGANINAETKSGRTVLIKSQNGNYSCSYELIEIFMRHIKKLFYLEFPVNKSNREWYYYESAVIFPDGSLFDEEQFDNECESEINKMDSIKINDRTTLKDLLFMKRNQMAQHAQNVTFNNILHSKNFDKKFPIFGYLLKLQSKNGLDGFFQIIDESFNWT